MNKFIDHKVYRYRNIVFEPIAKKLLSSKAVIQYLDSPVHNRMEQSEAFVEKYIRQYRNNEGAMWTVRKEGGTDKLGFIALLYYNEKHQYASFASCLLEEFWNQGIMTLAHQALIEIAFTQSRLNRIESQFYADHTAVANMLEKSGMHYEGTLKENFLIGDRFYDSKLYAITKSEYLQRKNRHQENNL